MSKRRIAAAAVVILCLCPVTIWLGSRLTGRSWYLTGSLLVLYTLALFFLAFERHRPAARELVTVAVLCALSVAARAAFFMVPHFKPFFAIVMLAGIAFGPEAGFLAGAVGIFASDFFFGMGAWTPWQMLASGLGGFLAGLLTRVLHLPKKRLPLTVLGFALTLLVIGPLLDTCSIFIGLAEITATGALAVYLAGLPVNFIQATATAATMLLIGEPLLAKLERLQVKYGMFGGAEHGL